MSSSEFLGRGVVGEGVDKFGADLCVPAGTAISVNHKNNLRQRVKASTVLCVFSILTTILNFS